ncbi:cytochrome c oxidase subunit 4 isoform 1, mitochondrial-like [Trichogramma pretiosum]|uniref:cytochrome c oxidase subunit 4 isoform 1, mitochondrial-like n=1 Tax=Trichogramma pretiosum TaxID=7493 RepID=UPI0006C973B9|nr:cytochrome c oxidase subunit 4 isoform 1, mitochondrial-like [Trichogramma pretiosum]XP_014234405.1 cytochrome c oxidase subunit 4 isoform 1, mitochondrial-like [Trichogramma pretiosum]XP_014234406.1 cytochrome c oxidase subunit 4 isoform 1, mitochondrial-like [Trichogramma pretiosum]XP_014234407.1 cytochrome c oxidase subunit 4 isoform 1, mitochondrial-like [Trichogramma pretiosum]
MATSRALAALLRNSPKQLQVRSYYTVNKKHGNREVVGHGVNGEPIYTDLADFPMPAIRYKEITPDLQALREKEKGDWKKLSIEDKKQLYRASFRQTFAEMEAPSGDWKGVLGITLLGVSFSLWFYVWLKHYVYPPLPITFDEEHRLAQLERMKLLDVAPISGKLKDL